MNGLDPALSVLGAPRPAQGAGPHGAAKSEARQASEQFESIFLLQVLNSMYVGLSTDGPFGGGPSEELFRSMLNEEIANEISRSGGIGIGDAVYRELLHLQEIRNANGTL